MKKPVVLMILDGWGIAPPSSTNAATKAQTPHLDFYFHRYPHGKLQPSGEAVGLPTGQMGNSEVGHLTIGSGRVIYQNLTRITRAIKDGSFEQNAVLLEAMNKAKETGHKFHVMGLLSDGGVHSHMDHLLGLLRLAKKEGLSEVYIHAFLDGRDTPPQSAGTYLKALQDAIKEIGIGKIATVSGRYYAMDRDKRWERIQKAYDAMTGAESLTAPSALEGLQAAYERGVTDEFVEPFSILGKEGSIASGDSLVCFNFRPDRAREITRAFADPSFTEVTRRDGELPVTVASMTEYDATLPIPVAFPPEHIADTLAETGSKKGLRQLHIAETEKYAHVTFFFNGGREEVFPGEDRILVPSPHVATYDLQPEMSAYIVTEKLQEALDQDLYDLIILNFANPDMVGHTGVMKAAVAAMEAVDECVGGLVDKILQKGGAVCITADHGNLEEMEDPVSHMPMTAHTTNPVPFLVIGAEAGTAVMDGGLSDIAPTLLSLMGLEKPEAMTGHSLLVKNPD